MSYSKLQLMTKICRDPSSIFEISMECQLNLEKSPNDAINIAIIPEAEGSIIIDQNTKILFIDSVTPSILGCYGSRQYKFKRNTYVNRCK